jgi:hypothetical protein
MQTLRTYCVSALPIRRFLLSGPVSSTTLSTGFWRSSFTHRCRSPALISFPSRVHRPLFFTGSQFRCRSPVTEPTSFAGPPFVHGSTDLPRSPVRFPVPLSFLSHCTYVVRRASFRSRVHGPASLTSPHFRAFTHPRFASRSSVLRSSVIPRSSSPFSHGSRDLSRSPFPTSPLPPCFIGSHFRCCSSVPSWGMVVSVGVYTGPGGGGGGGVFSDHVNHRQYTTNSDAISLLLPPIVVCSPRVA